MPIGDNLDDDTTATLRDLGRVPIQDVFVDVLGSLVPGILFISALLPALVFPLDSLLRRMTSGSSHLVSFEAFVEASTSVSVVAVLFGVVAAYVVGHLFFRQTPAAADKASWQCLKAMGHEADDPGDYPYNNLPKQLEDRGLSYLAKRVPWAVGGDRRPTKHFINALKIRLGFSYPGRMGTIIRNEGHIRLSSSMWHVCRSLVRPCVLGVACGVASNAVYGWHVVGVWPPGDLMALVQPTLVLLGSWRVRASIERTLHYQRRREIFFILETADWAMRVSPGVDLFAGLAPVDGKHETIVG